MTLIDPPVASSDRDLVLTRIIDAPLANSTSRWASMRAGGNAPINLPPLSLRFEEE